MAYATIDDLIHRFDARTIGDLVAIDGARVPVEDLPDDEVAQAALDDASGEIDAALLKGKFYTPADLANLTANSNKYLVKICCLIAMASLWDRKPGLMAETAEKHQQQAEAILVKLKHGAEIFAVQGDASHEEAGLPEITGPTRVTVQNTNALATRLRGRMYPAIELPRGR